MNDMNHELLAVPREKVGEVIRIIRLGINRARQIGMPLSDETADNLNAWCREQEQARGPAKKEA